MASSPSYLYTVAAMVFITTGLVTAAIRWFHMCRPFDKNPRYYYPGRPFVVGVYVSALALLPYALHPESADAWKLAKVYFLPVTLYHYTILLFAYFGTVMQWRKWRWPMFIIGLPVALFLLAAVVLALIPGEQAGRIFRVVFFLLGGMMTVVCLVSMGIVLRWSSRFDLDEYSNPADFPVTFARKWLVIILVNVPLCWLGALFNSQALLAVMMVFFACTAVLFVISALHPHRHRPVEAELPDEPAPAEALASGSQSGSRSLSENRRLEILSAVCCVVEEEEAFLNPHLTMQDVADRSGYNRSYISTVIKSEFGGFFSYVNRLRLKHLDDWVKEHPKCTIQEAAEESGFKSRQSYYNVKARLEKE